MSYLKGKDIKTKGDCLVYCYTRRIELIAKGVACHTDSYYIQEDWLGGYTRPEGFEKW